MTALVACGILLSAACNLPAIVGPRHQTQHRRELRLRIISLEMQQRLGRFAAKSVAIAPVLCCRPRLLASPPAASAEGSPEPGDLLGNALAMRAIPGGCTLRLLVPLCTSQIWPDRPVHTSQTPAARVGDRGVPSRCWPAQSAQPSVRKAKEKRHAVLDRRAPARRQARRCRSSRPANCFIAAIARSARVALVRCSWHPGATCIFQPSPPLAAQHRQRERPGGLSDARVLRSSDGPLMHGTASHIISTDLPEAPSGRQCTSFSVVQRSSQLSRTAVRYPSEIRRQLR